MAFGRSNCVKTIWHPDSHLSVKSLTPVLRDFGEFLPEPLSKVVDIDVYAEKLIRLSDIALATVNEEPAGVLAMYANDLDSHVAFISILSVSPKFRRLGIGKSLVSQSIERARTRGMNSITLKVVPNNEQAINLYNLFSFRVKASLPGRVLMEKELTSSASLDVD